MKTSLRLFALILTCSPALGTITVTSWIAAQLQPGESASFSTGGPDGNIWATEQAKGQILKINPADGSVTRYALPANTIPLQITAGPDGNLWFSGGQLQGGSPVSIIVRVTPAGLITTFNYPEARAFVLLSSGPIAGSSDGKVYVVNTASKKIGIINPAASAKVGTSSLVLSEIALPFGLAGIPSIAPRQTGGIDYCGQSAKDCGTLIDGALKPFTQLLPGFPTGVSECSVAGATNMICVNSTSTLGGSESKLSICDSSGTCTNSDWPNDGCAAGKISCNGTDCVAAAAPAPSYDLSCFDLKAADLTSSPPTLYKIGGPGRVPFLEAHVLETNGVIATGQNPATRDFNVYFGKATVAAAPRPNLTVAKTIIQGSGAPRVGDNVIVELIVTNIGDARSGGDWQVVDDLPDCLDVSSKYGTTGTSDTQCFRSGKHIKCNSISGAGFSLAPGESFRPFSIWLRITKTGLCINTAVVSGGGNAAPNRSNPVEFSAVDPRSVMPLTNLGIAGSIFDRGGH